MVHIDDIVIDGIVEVLQDALYTSVADLKVPNIKAGRLFNNAERAKGLNALVSLAPAGTVPSEEHSEGRISIPTHQIGGGVFNRKTFIVQLVLVFHTKDQDKARRDANAIIGRAHQALHRMTLPLHPTTGQPKDDFDEGLVIKEVGPQTKKETGAPGDFLWDVDLTIDFWTFKP